MSFGVRSKRWTLVCLAGSVTFAAGCHSHYIDATVHNATGGPATVVEVDYPSASFGKELLPAGADFHYRFKILGSGATKVLWTDAAHHDHSVAGPSLQEGQEGKLVVTLTPTGATWNVQLTAKVSRRGPLELWKRIENGS